MALALRLSLPPVALLLILAYPFNVYASDRIDSPTDGSTLSGQVEIRGTAQSDGPNFRSYKLEFGAGREPATWQPILPIPYASIIAGAIASATWIGFMLCREQ